MPRAPLLLASSPYPASLCCPQAALAPRAPAARKQPLPCAPLLPASSLCPSAPKRASAPYSQARQRVPQPQKRRRALLPNAPLLHELLLLLLTAPTAAPTPTVTDAATTALAPLLLTATACHGHYHEAAALGASESAAALGAGEFAAAPGAIESAAALGARVSTATGPSSAEALYPFTLDSGASRSFFRDCTTLTPLAAPIPVSLADPTGGPVVARASSVLPCPAVPSGSLSGLHLPTFSTNLESNAAILDVWVDTFIPGGQRVAICTRSRTGRHLATFTRRPRSNLYTLTTSSAQVAEAGQVVASSQVSTSGHLATSCSCRVLSHQNLLWHHRLGNPSLPRLRSMHSRLLVSGLPRSLPSLPCSPAPPCLLCAEGRQLAAPHSSEFFPTTAPLQTLHMDMWGPAPVGGTVRMIDERMNELEMRWVQIGNTVLYPLRATPLQPK
ncbi:unnamed protein product [Closterium sp. NIES-54]